MYTIGFDLDMTLLDTRPGIAAAYRELSARTGVHIDAEAAVARLGPPLELELARWFPAAEVPAAVEAYRALYPAYAITPSVPVPGAAAAVDAVRARGGRVIVITAKKGPLARLHLDHHGLAVDVLVGLAWAEGKTAALREHRVALYVGDHVADMAAARAAGVTAVGLATGACTADELRAAGAATVLPDLTGLARWLDLCWTPPPG